MAHKHADILKALADNPDLQVQVLSDSGIWQPTFHEYLFRSPDYTYRLAPKCLVINGESLVPPAEVGNYCLRLTYGTSDGGRIEWRDFFHTKQLDARAHYEALVKAST
jgi:hypothetical protein